MTVRLDDPGFVERPAARLLTGFAFTEGPVWVGGELVFSDIPGDTTYRWSEADGLRPLRRPSNKSNGNTLDSSGRLVSCEHATSQVVRTEPDGSMTSLATHYQGHRLNSPNDVVVSRDGSVWFTDPPFGRTLSDMGVVRPPELAFSGVYRLDLAAGRLDLLLDDLREPNGLCFDRDESHLFVNDTASGLVHRFRVTRDDEGRAALVEGDVFCRIPGDDEGSVDGMKVDAEGNLYCTGPGGVHVLDAGGVPLTVITCPEKVGNFAWGGPDLRTLYLCASSSLYEVRTVVPGWTNAAPSC